MTVRGAVTWGEDQLLIAAILASGVAVGAIVRRVWPFYRAMLADAPDLAPSDGRVRYDALDGLRGILCLFVVVNHSAATLWLPLIPPGAGLGDAGAMISPALVTGGLAVGVFFAITAFLFYGRVVETNRAPDPNRFLLQRVARIGPALLASGVLIFVVDACSTRELMPTHPGMFLRVMLKLGTFGAVGPGIVPQNAYVFWTLPYEWMFYLAFPVLAASVVAGVPVWARLAACFAMASLNSGVIGKSAPAMMFLPGMAAIHLVDRPAIQALARSWLGSAAVLAIAIVAPALTNSGPSMFPGVLIVLIAFTLIVAGCDVFGLLRLPALRAVGVASYSVYLLHGIVLFAARPLLLDRSGPTPRGWGIVIGLTAVTVGLAFASYRWIEHPGIALGRSWTRPRTAPDA